MGERRQMCIWLNLNLNLKFEFANSLQYTSIKWNVPQTSTMNFMSPLYHVLVHLLSMLPPLLMIALVIAYPRRRSPPKQKTDKSVYHQQGKQTPLIMSIKSHYPLSLTYALIWMITLLSILPHS